ncbi:hypothetical protein [Chitinophaga arvensicola]|uniref:Uncharacterized protein n=1 Tax=Chitinophaga arvensicola TaxID=29529 RepID=A0A1I0RWS8_9BACT|nr:hypothetical protein [Chitinophaga arvensicola]SEW45273.1 hypothetical protein SAMN04488122_3443 [Chitinophaga arvensicola]
MKITNAEYEQTIANGVPKILDENMLFWHMWNITYIYDILEKNQEGYEAYVELLRPIWNFCWDAVAAKKINQELFEKVFGEVYPFEINEEGEIEDPKNIIQETYDELRDDHLPEYCISNLIGAFSTVYDYIGTGEHTIYDSRAGSRTIGMIFQIIASNGLGVSFDAQNISLPILQDEFQAQEKLLLDLMQPNRYTIDQKYIYRNADAMNSLRYIPQEEDEV